MPRSKLVFSALLKQSDKNQEGRSPCFLVQARCPDRSRALFERRDFRMKQDSGNEEFPIRARQSALLGLQQEVDRCGLTFIEAPKTAIAVSEQIEELEG